jgi:AraC family L-rhamnose operon transcriptional activator RhaR/AraC family L-rhamnose operon regulatory protein RhaS
MATALFMQLVGHLSRAYARSKSANSPALLRIGEAISHLEKNYHEAIDLALLAQIANMSQRNFIRGFQAALDVSPIAHLVQLRINRAASLLRLTDQSVTEIAFQVGFTDSNYFARQFRKHLGTPPSAYRKARSL